MCPTKRRRGRPAADASAKARRREEILAVAARVFAKRGYQATTMQEVADAVGIAKGTLFLYFPKKEGLFLAAADQGMTRMQAAVDAALETSAEPMDVFRLGIRAYLQFFADHPEQVELLIQERAEFRDRKQSTYFEHRSKRQEHFEGMMQEMIDSGRLRAMPVSRLDDVLCDLVYGTMFTNHFTARRKPVDEQVNDILDIVFHGILGEGSAPAGESDKRGGQ